MSNRGAKLVVMGKLVVAAIAVVASVALPARHLAPSTSLAQLLLYYAVGVVGVVGILGLVIIGAICSLQFSQFILRAGGTDAQWFWFPGEPKGLAALRRRESDIRDAGD